MQDKEEARPSPDPGMDKIQEEALKPPQDAGIDLNDEKSDKDALKKKEAEAKEQAEGEAKKQAQAKAEAEAKTQAEAKANAEKEAQDRLDSLAQKMKSASSSSTSQTPEPAKPPKSKNPFANAYKLVEGNLKPEDAKKLTDDFDKEFPGKRAGDTMCFGSREEASAFFEEQAKNGTSFLVREQGRDYYMYSDGKGDFFKGTEAELKEHMDAKKEAEKEDNKGYSQEENPNDKALDSGKDENKEQGQEHKQQEENPEPEPDHDPPAPH